MSSGTSLAVALSIEGLDAGHPAVEQAYAELLDDARAVPGLTVDERMAPVQGRKGGELANLLLVPGGSAVVVAVARIFRLWLQRDRARSLSVTVSRAGSEDVTVQASGEAVSIEALERGIQQALERSRPEAD
ncbi:effector-associated constant component EACC1 [Streptomyces sp. CBMA156]|uniref:effector-associated constant component EACC1 n=1 Tax=Streptomyces sp. CBMA156 TaxID=1930280 RepID=UPI001661DE0B|nr:hypothetical protein [Streptomyces sp. CBMA156]MBD0673998.1 hypothetical protein [Streptomyces sp. CBMA156]